MSVEETILALEQRAMERWAAGDPDGFLELSAPEVTYFDPFVERRLDNRDELRALYETLRGKVSLARFEFVRPMVQCFGDTAVLSFQFVSNEGGEVMQWNTTEVYTRIDNAWRIVHTHWALPKPAAANA